MLSLRSVISSIGNQLKLNNWEMLVQRLTHLMKTCSPNELYEAKSLDPDFQKPLDDILT
jgi:hypothetical protein